MVVFRLYSKFWFLRLFVVAFSYRLNEKVICQSVVKDYDRNCVIFVIDRS